MLLRAAASKTSSLRIYRAHHTFTTYQQTRLRIVCLRSVTCSGMAKASHRITTRFPTPHTLEPCPCLQDTLLLNINNNNNPLHHQVARGSTSQRKKRNKRCPAADPSFYPSSFTTAATNPLRLPRPHLVAARRITAAAPVKGGHELSMKTVLARLSDTVPPQLGEGRLALDATVLRPSVRRGTNSLSCASAHGISSTHKSICSNEFV